MTEETLAWESLLETHAPPGCRLRAALLTTYDRPDTRFLVEHLLPVFLRLNREADSEGSERQSFFVELTQRLEALHGRFVIVSSNQPDVGMNPEENLYPWLWRYLQPLVVGRTGKAVQHAKVWLLHWAAQSPELKEYLEIVVCSANLSMSAFKHQIQNAWRTCIPLDERRTNSRQRSWGILPDFLIELGKATGSPGALAPFVDLLARAECPADTWFIASVPGSHTTKDLRRTPWGSAGLSFITKSANGITKASVLAPYIGTWSTEALERWCESVGGRPSNVQLIWIDRDHPWARDGRWILPRETLQTLEKIDANIMCLRHGQQEGERVVRFHDAHRSQDARWSHAKVYYFRRGRSSQLLLTSANFSPAAWGAPREGGGLRIENFELGVCLAGVKWPFADLEPFDSFDRIATVAKEPARVTTALLWASASWDGKMVTVECRTSNATSRLTGHVVAGDLSLELDNWKAQEENQIRLARIPWDDAKHPPELAALSAGEAFLEVPVFDARPQGSRNTTPIPEVEEAIAEAIRDQLLFEEYGGAPTSDLVDEQTEGGDVLADAGPALNDDGATSEHGDSDLDDGLPLTAGDSYSVPAFEHARVCFGIVDAWASRISSLPARPETAAERRTLEQDGEHLIAAFGRRAARQQAKSEVVAMGARLAAEELRLRLDLCGRRS